MLIFNRTFSAVIFAADADNEIITPIIMTSAPDSSFFSNLEILQLYKKFVP